MKTMFCVIALSLMALVPSSVGFANEPVDVRQQAVDGKYWISSTGKTHNSSCRYYQNCKGRASDSGSGDNCKICGGDSK